MSLSAVDNSSQCIHSLSIQQEIKFNEIWFLISAKQKKKKKENTKKVLTFDSKHHNRLNYKDKIY